MDSLSWTSTSRSQLRHSDRRELAGTVSERLPAGPALSVDPVHRVAAAVLHLVLQQSARARQLPCRLRGRLLRDRLHRRAMI